MTHVQTYFLSEIQLSRTSTAAVHQLIQHKSNITEWQVWDRVTPPKFFLDQVLSALRSSGNFGGHSEEERELEVSGPSESVQLHHLDMFFSTHPTY